MWLKHLALFFLFGVAGLASVLVGFEVGDPFRGGAARDLRSAGALPERAQPPCLKGSCAREEGWRRGQVERRRRMVRAATHSSRDESARM